MRAHRLLALLSIVIPLSASAEDLADLFPDLVQQAQVGLTPIVTIVGGPNPGTFSPDAGEFVVGTFDATASVDNLSGQIAGQFQRFPVGSTVAAFTFQFDPELNVFNRSTEGLGPLLSERAQTTGKGKFNTSFAYSRVEFSVFEGDDLDEINVGFVGTPVTISSVGAQTTSNYAGGGGLIDFAESLPLAIGPGQVIQFQNPQGSSTITGPGVAGVHTDTFTSGNVSVPGVRSLLDAELDVDVFAFFLNYGVTDWLDVGAVVPLLNVEGTGQVTTIGIVDQNTGASTISQTPRESDSSFGFGDILLRAKARVLTSKFVDAAVRGDVTLPTGDEDELRGYGDPAFGPTLILSKTFGIISPHANAGLNFRTDDPDQNTVRWASGLDVQPFEVLTLTVDVIGEHLLDRNEDIGKDIFGIAGGLKVNPWRRLVLSGNALVRLNDEGLRADVIPSAALEYTFF